MRLALLSDIHANKEAFEAVLTDLEQHDIDQLVFLGDVVGYGPDPEWCVDTLELLVKEGALALRGNHDRSTPAPDSLNPAARKIIDWTVNRLNARQRLFLADLPYQLVLGDLLCVHASPDQPQQWCPVSDAAAAAASFAASAARVILCGHVHRPALYSLDLASKINTHGFTPRTAIPLLASRRWLAVIGSVGQPRDGSGCAGYAILDQAQNSLSYRQVAYDSLITADKVRAAQLPEAFARRLILGV
ncbi:metallophosphoesterase family protein [Cypionkella sp.]|uniref:metallophosphoesterase family protein n=1 Tax=Cypionkella sp. TaxID=2811411 RepID=UPI00276C7E0B|nr:metallophosphoesterase family protein [Cypionkella sp.]